MGHRLGHTCLPVRHRHRGAPFLFSHQTSWHQRETSCQCYLSVSDASYLLCLQKEGQGSYSESQIPVGLALACRGWPSAIPMLPAPIQRHADQQSVEPVIRHPAAWQEGTSPWYRPPRSIASWSPINISCVPQPSQVMQALQ